MSSCKYIVSAGWADAREEFWHDDGLRFETDDYHEAERAYHDIWLPDLRADYRESWDAFCDAEDPECWKSIACERSDGHTPVSFTVWESTPDEERPAYKEIEEAFKAAQG